MSSMSSHNPQESPAPGMPPTTSKPPRIVAPDVARGLVLLSIAWANISTAWAIPPEGLQAASLGGVAHTGALGLLDQIAVVASTMFAHVRGLPMFSTLLGFGVGLLAMSLWRRAYPPGKAKRALARRYGWLAVIGVVHCLLLFYGDIILLYSLLALILILMITLKDKTLLIIAAVLYSVHVVITLVTVAFTGSTDLGSGTAMSLPETYVDYLAYNAIFVFGYVVSVPVAGLSLLPVMIVGFVAARKGVHRHPEQYLKPLWAWVIVTAAIIVFVGLPWGLSAVGVLPTDWELYLSGINGAVGYLTGPGIAAAVLLACRGLQSRVDAAHEQGDTEVRWPLPLEMVVALGKRSMSGYILLSVLFFVLCLPFTLNLGSEVGAFGQFLIALGIWAVVVLAAWLLERAGARGPVEQVHRRLSYGKRGRLPDRYVPKHVEEPAYPSLPGQEQPGQT